MKSEDFLKIYIIENKLVSRFSTAGVMKKKGGEKMRLSYANLLKTNVEKMSVNRSLAMLMKPNELPSLSGDVVDNKG